MERTRIPCLPCRHKRPESKRFTIWRVSSGLSLSGLSAGDVLRFEEEEYGNDLHIFAQDKTLVEHLPASRLVWACLRRTDARRYGSKPDRSAIRGRVIGHDGDNGYLFLLDDGEPGCW